MPWDNPDLPKFSQRCPYCKETQCLCDLYVNASPTEKISIKAMVDFFFTGFANKLSPAELGYFILAWHFDPDACIASLNALKNKKMKDAGLYLNKMAFTSMGNISIEELRRMYFDEPHSKDKE